MNTNATREVIFIFGGNGGFQPGSFAESLIGAFAKADSSNFAKLALVFPEYAEAVSVAKTEGVAALEARVSGSEG